MQIPSFPGRIIPGNRGDLGNVTKNPPIPGGKISLFSGVFGKILSHSY